MVYSNSTPKIFAQRPLIEGSPALIVDDIKHTDNATKIVCGHGKGNFGKPFTVKSEIRVTFDVSDYTWLIFVSEPTEFVCSNAPLADSVPNAGPPDADTPIAPVSGGELDGPHFLLKATKPMEKGMVRIALANNCTTGKAQTCDPNHNTDDNHEDFIKLLRKHADIYPSGNSDIWFAFPEEANEDDDIVMLNFDWMPGRMSKIKELGVEQYQPLDDVGPDTVELLMYASPHHQERLQASAQSSNEVQGVGCTPLLHGLACPAVGSHWSMVEHLHHVNFYGDVPIRKEMLPAIKKAAKQDIEYSIPMNYQKGAGDTYFSGKMLARLARIILVADRTQAVTQTKLDSAVARLRSGVEIWLNGSAASPFLYDRHWGGISMCGCNFDESAGVCTNTPPDCPALEDPGQNFGAGFYNDHHFHFGYHIYAAAVVARYDSSWGIRFFQHVLLLIRDIANPSPEDPFFPTFRHKDWFLGFSWANGVVAVNPNGRNQESSAEAIHAYEAMALYGKVMEEIFAKERMQLPTAYENHVTSVQIKNLGKLLFSTEVRSAKTYWHVQSAENCTNGVRRVYPEAYTGKVVGMIWSMLAQEQTWFGNMPHLSYGKHFHLHANLLLGVYRNIYVSGHIYLAISGSLVSLDEYRVVSLLIV
jgi:hypothetical protein